MFCDTCHWYTAGEKICPHCGAVQSPKKAKDMFNLPGDVSVLDDKLINTPVPVPKPAAPPPQGIKFCVRCGTGASIASRFCSRCGAPLK